MASACCNTELDSELAQKQNDLSAEDSCCGTDHTPKNQRIFLLFLPGIISFVLLLTALGWDHLISQNWFSGWIRFVWYMGAYLPVGFPVIKQAVHSIRHSDFFSEFFLMSIATFGAFAIGEYPEAVAVMLFYSIGETLQGRAVNKAKGNIKSLLDQLPEKVNVLRNNKRMILHAKEAKIGDILQLKPGEKLALDGELLSESGSFDTAALTGESKPDTKYKGEKVLAGMINLNKVCHVKVNTAYADSKLSKILALVQDAITHKAPTELFIRKFAKIYTPIVVFLAIGITFLPVLFVNNYIFSDWLYRALVFLVISCPCALVISIPLGYFGGIGAGSHNGILFKGSNFLDSLAGVKAVVMDKTGTLTEGVFKVRKVHIESEFNEAEIMKLVNFLESHSSHPVATAINDYFGKPDSSILMEDIEEIPGLGIKATVEGKQLLVGNFKLLDRFAIPYNMTNNAFDFTVIAIAFDRKYAGYLSISDQIKSDAKAAVERLHKMNVKTFILSGDKNEVVQKIARELGIDKAYGELLPHEKVAKVKKIKNSIGKLAFVGDGVNDAPVIALSDIGMAMGGLGSDAAIETADVVIQDDMPSRIPMAIDIGKQTKKIVWQNISLAFGIKMLVMILGAMGLASMWEAVFADVGVALLAILNAIRIQRKKI